MSDKNAICNRCKFDYTDHQLEIMCMDENGNCQKCRAELSGKFADGKSLMVGVDMVNHPPHYKDASGIECIEVTKHMQFCGGNCFKYLYRAGKKGSTVEDLKKAAWYAERAWIMNEVVPYAAIEGIEKIAAYRTGNIQSAMHLISEYDWYRVEWFINEEVAMLGGSDD